MTPAGRPAGDRAPRAAAAERAARSRRVPSSPRRADLSLVTASPGHDQRKGDNARSSARARPLAAEGVVAPHFFPGLLGWAWPNGAEQVDRRVRATAGRDLRILSTARHHQTWRGSAVPDEGAGAIRRIVRNAMLNQTHAQQLLGRDMIDRDGTRIGEITQVFVDDRTGEPTWVTVKTGWFGLSESFVPLNKVQWSDDRVQAAYDTGTVKDAPRFATDQPLSARDEDMLHAHYGLSDPAARLPQQSPSGDAAGPLGATEGDVRAVLPGSRGRMRRYEPPTESVAGAVADRPLVCRQCGAFIAPDLLARHDAFHATVDGPPGSDTRRDVDVEPEPFVRASTIR